MYFNIHTVLLVGFTEDRYNISENYGTVDFVVTKQGQTNLLIQVDLSITYNTTGRYS